MIKLRMPSSGRDSGNTNPAAESIWRRIRRSYSHPRCRCPEGQAILFRKLRREFIERDGSMQVYWHRAIGKGTQRVISRSCVKPALIPMAYAFPHLQTRPLALSKSTIHLPRHTTQSGTVRDCRFLNNRLDLATKPDGNSCHRSHVRAIAQDISSAQSAKANPSNMNNLIAYENGRIQQLSFRQQV